MPYNIIRVNNTAFNQVKEKVESTLLLPEGFSGAKRIPNVPVSNTFFHITPSGDVSLYSIAILEQNINLVNTKHQQVDAWASQSNQSAIDSAASATLAQKFAENEKDIEVLSGLYSAKHWSLVTLDLKNSFATEAQGYVQTALTHANSSETFKDQSSAIHDAVALMQDDVTQKRLAASTSAYNASVSESRAKDSETLAAGYATDALASKVAAETSATQSASSASTALTYKNDANTAKNQAQAARDTASGHSQSASSSAAAASTSETNAATSAQSAQTSSVNASSAKSAAQAAETSAKQWRDEAEGFRNEAQAIVGGISYNYNDLTNVPTTFTPKAHTHNASDINAGVFNRERIPVDLNSTTFSGQVSAVDGTGRMLRLWGQQGTEAGELSLQAVQDQRWSAQLRFGPYGAKLTGGYNSTLINLSANLNASELNRGTVPNARLPETATRWPTLAEVGAAAASHGHGEYVVKAGNANLNSLTLATYLQLPQTRLTSDLVGLKVDSRLIVEQSGTDSIKIVPENDNQYVGITTTDVNEITQWLLYQTNDAARNLSLQGRDDTGGYQHTTFRIFRSTGVMEFLVEPKILNKRIYYEGNKPTLADISDMPANFAPSEAPLLLTTDLNTLNSAVDAGFYLQHSNANTPGNNYPKEHAGSLVVLPSANGVTQTYITYDPNSTEMYFRSYYNSNQGSWRRAWTDGNHGSGSGLDADKLDGYHASSFILKNGNVDGTNITFSNAMTLNGFNIPGQAGFYSATNSSLGGRFLFAPRHYNDTAYRWSDEFGWSLDDGWHFDSNLTIKEGMLSLLSSSEQLLFKSQAAGEVHVGFEDDWLRFRFGGGNIPEGIRIDNEDSITNVLLSRNGQSRFNNGLYVSGTGTIGGSGGSVTNAYLRVGETLGLDPNEIYFATTGHIGTTSGDLNLSPSGKLKTNSPFAIKDKVTLDISGDSLHVSSIYGWASVGVNNTSYCHFYTDRPKNYFSKSIDVNGILKIYNTGTEIKQYGSKFEAEAGTKVTSGGQLLGAGMSIVQNDTASDALMTYHIAGSYAIHFGLESTRRRLMVGGWSDGAGTEKDVLTRKGQYFNALGNTVTLNYVSTGNHAFIQLWGVSSNNAGRLTIGSGYRIGDIIEIANNNPLGILNIRSTTGGIYLPDGTSLAANVDAQITVAGKITLYNFSGNAWMLSVG